MRIGELEILPVVDGAVSVPAAAAYAHDGTTGKGTNAADWEPHDQFLDADGKLEIVMGGFLIRSGARVMLVDAGLGPANAMGLPGGRFLDSLAGHGVQPGHVTDMVFTHLHFDHVGWASDAGEAVFPNATYRCDVRDWQHFVGSDEQATQKLTPIEPRLELFDGDTTLAPGIDARLASGHTPGSTIIVLSSGEDRALLIGDIVHCPVELVDDEWSGMADVDPALAQRTRNALARELEGSDVPVAAAHFPGLEFGRVLAGTGRRQWVFG
jgi:glyoxylase-like metal-dependent hydrolase (beta-lactamase superfamily II)